MKIQRVTQYRVTEDGLGFDVQFEPILGSVKIAPRPEGGHVVGYLVFDEDCQDPLDNDGAGKIGTSSRRDSREMNSIYREALGLDTYYYPDLVGAIEILNEAEGDPGQWHWYESLRKYMPSQESYWDDLEGEAASKMFAKLRQLGKIGNPHAVLLDVYEHGGRVYRVQGRKDMSGMRQDQKQEERKEQEMNPAIKIVHDQKRGCGWRHSGLYLMGGSAFSDCGKLPLALDGICDCCGSPVIPQREKKGGGIDYQLPRTLRKFDAARLFGAVTCEIESTRCYLCVINHTTTGYLIGVGTKNYSPTSFLEEAGRLGLSKRIAQIPREFKVGESVVFLAHREVVTRIKITEEAHQVETVLHSGDGGTGVALVPEKIETVTVPGVFCIFVPDRIEYVVKGDESDEEIDGLIKRGITPVLVKRVDEQGQLLPATWAEAETEVRNMAAALASDLRECKTLADVSDRIGLYVQKISDKYGIDFTDPSAVSPMGWRHTLEMNGVETMRGNLDNVADKLFALTSVWFKESEAENGDEADEV